jgi:meso-butanediol dehydrogenase / (S,S)-butanediol dehydrogenase / diacetyl reductase
LGSAWLPAAVLAEHAAVGRAGHVADIAAARLYLGSDASRYFTGAILAVDGGWTAS